MRRFYVVVLLCLSTLAVASLAVASTGHQIYNYKLKTIDGVPTTLAPYQGKVLLLVNVASSCGYTPQYAALESVYEKYKDRGLVIVGIPANNFANQEAGTEQEIKKFCDREVSRHFPDDVEGVSEGWGSDSALHIPDEQDHQSEGRR